jgi:MarR family transcriptional regulator, transcriptional regulator for hemolysin
VAGVTSLTGQELPPRLSQLVSRAFRALARLGDAALKPLGLRYAQIPVFALLRTGAALTQKSLADATGIEQPSMAQLLSRMERDGLVGYRRHPTDARSRTVFLVAPDDPSVTEGHRRLEEIERQALDGLTDDEIATLKSLLARVLTNLECREGGLSRGSARADR